MPKDKIKEILWDSFWGSFWEVESTGNSIFSRNVMRDLVELLIRERIFMTYSWYDTTVASKYTIYKDMIEKDLRRVSNEPEKN